MTDELARREVEYDREQIDLIKASVAKGATDLELRLFLYQCKKTGLDPLSRQIHFIKRWSTRLQKDEGTIQTGIDGYRAIADRTGQYAGSDDAVFGVLETYPKSATVTVWKLVGGQRCSFTATAWWEEYYPGDDNKQSFFWKKMPHGQLSKCAEALALRKAFPQQLSGVYTHEEMQQAGPEYVQIGDKVVEANTKEAAQVVADAKIKELQAKVNPPGKSAEAFVKDHPPAEAPKAAKVIVEVQGIVGPLSPDKTTKKGQVYHTVVIGQQECFVFDSKLGARLKAIATYETAVRCEKREVSGKTIFTVVGFVGDPIDEKLPF